MQSCSNEPFENDGNNQQLDNANQKAPKQIESLNLSKTDQLKVDFGRAFAQALKESPELRQFIKQEALKQFNKDYDVLYNLVKHKPVSGKPSTRQKNGSVNSLDGLMQNYFEEKGTLDDIQSQLPLLTVFVPKLPENSFSAESWDPNDPSQIPVVGVRVDNTNEVPMIDAVNNHEYVLEDDVIPGYPVVVIKNNERLAVNTNDHNFARSTEVLEAQDGTSYRFLDDNLNANLTRSTNRDFLQIDDGNDGGSCNPPFPIISGRENTVPQFLKTAHDVFDGRISQPWQRDNIYYQLTPTQTTNTYVGGRYLEAITYFRLNNNNPELIFSIMSDQNNSANPDPMRTNQSWERDRTRVPWTDGAFEIGVSVTDNSKTRGNINMAFTFPAAPEELFIFSYESIVRRRGWGITWKRTYWRPKIDGFKGMDFTSTNIDAIKLHIHAWDLTEYSNIWHLDFKEVDVSTEITTKTTNVKKYNTNVSINIPLGEKEKAGLKFGASVEETNTDERNFKWVEGSDELGRIVIPFGDKTVIKNPCDGKLYPRLYNNASITLEMRPVQVEF
ncbi:hypothetical protein JCM19538_1957 [Jejuia pallidilutea]|uniref:Uncharacterized protein n=4 Tax=Jejuia pallidilutea TaxID=504487 RepID=A0A098LRI6_9FLAO|nr:hypothetical protein JCM19538_1957 [Jejuia pallidilutea]